MAVTVPSEYTVVPASSLIVPKMSGPLNTILKNTNWLYVNHRPPHVSFAPLAGSVSARTGTHIVACNPSVDGLSYDFEHRLMPQGGATSITIELEANSGNDPATGWTTVYGPTAHAVTSGTFAVLSHAAVLPAGATMLRLQYSGGDHHLHHVLGYPAPADTDLTAAPAIKASGFRPWDDALLMMGGGPVNTEMVDRTKRNGLSILQDREQIVGSLVQEAVVAPAYSAPGPGMSNPSAWMRIGKARGFLQGQTSARLMIRVLADTDQSSTADLVMVKLTSTKGSAQNYFAADGLLHEGAPSSPLQLPGGLDSWIDFEVLCRSTESGRTTNVRSVVVHWRPGEPA